MGDFSDYKEGLCTNPHGRWGHSQCEVPSLSFILERHVAYTRNGDPDPTYRGFMSFFDCITDRRIGWVRIAKF